MIVSRQEKYSDRQSGLVTVVVQGASKLTTVLLWG